MKKLIAIFCFLFLFVANDVAQTAKWNISVLAGASFPVGKFGSQDIHDSAAAFAKTGIILNISGSYLFSRYIGLTVLVSGQQNNPDTKAMIKNMENAVRGVEFGVTSGSWQIGRILAGPCFSVPLNKKEKVHINMCVMAGVLKTSMPKITITESYIDNSLNHAEEEYSEGKTSLPWTFAWQAGIGLQYRLKPELSILLNLDYASSSPEAPRFPVAITPGGVPNYYSINGNANGIFLPVAKSSQSPSSYKQSINSINLCVGLRYDL